MTRDRAPSPAPRHRRPPVVRHLMARPRLAVALAVFVGLCAVLSMATGWRVPTIVLVAWNLAVTLLLALDCAMMATADRRAMEERAAALDDGAEVILGLSVAAAAASLVAILFELAVVKDLSGAPRLAHVGLALATVATAWGFIHTMFAVHYAHEFFQARAAGVDAGLNIPRETDPDYWDFLYVAVVIGTSGQTADVEFTSKAMRRVGLVHCGLAFAFNTVVLALTINIAAGIV